MGAYGYFGARAARGEDYVGAKHDPQISGTVLLFFPSKVLACVR